MPQDASIQRITQQILEEFRWFQAVQQRYWQQRSDLIDLLRQGAPIEPGPLTARLDVRPQKRITASALERWLTTAVEELRQLLPPTDYHYVAILPDRGFAASRRLIQVATPRLRQSPQNPHCVEGDQIPR
jgi:hypothetical protein